MVLDDELFALGGHQSTTGVPLDDLSDAAEVYDARADRWSDAGFALPQPLRAFAATIPT